MKKLYMVLLSAIAMLSIQSNAQVSSNFLNAPVPKPNVTIPFGKKLPPPDLSVITGTSQITSSNTIKTAAQHTSIPGSEIKKTPEYFRQLLLEKRKEQTSVFSNQPQLHSNAANTNSSSNFHLIKDINALSESNPYNYNSIFDLYYNQYYGYTILDSISFAILDNVIYFVADDGIHGNELWRSDGTEAGTYLFNDLTSGSASTDITNIVSAAGKIFFTNGFQLWMSDGTEAGTQALDVYDASTFFTLNNKTYFIADGVGIRTSIWQTDGTVAGTTQVIDIGGRNGGGEAISQPTNVNGLLFFTFLDYNTFNWQIWRSDLTDAGTYNVGPGFPFIDETGQNATNYVPAQLTGYNNKLYFSANDGTGRKLWVSDGTDAGTKKAANDHGILIDADYLGTSFPVVNDILCIPGEEPKKGNGLYIYNASNNNGLIKIKDFAPAGNSAFIVPKEMFNINNTLYFKVTSNTGGIHDELWSSKATAATTQLITASSSKQTINNLYNADGTLYFVKSDKFFGAELWKVFATPFGMFPTIVSDIFNGDAGSYPSHLTAFKGKLIFSAADEKKGNELYLTNNTLGFGATLVKDINTTTTSTSLAAFNPYNYLGYAGMITLGNDVLFTAYERAHGNELYKSNGTTEGTKLLNNIMPGDAGFTALLYISKNDAVYFIAITNNGYAIYKTKGTQNSLVKITPDYASMITFAVADNGLVFYEVYNADTGNYELWRSDGTLQGTYLLSSTLYYSYFSYLNTAGNTAFFAAGDATHGYELWKSDGSIAGTALVKDINPGIGDSDPAGMFVYKSEVYFRVYDGKRNSFWKSDGTKTGTIKLKNIDPWYGSTVQSTAKYYFEVSNNILYFSAVDTSNIKGTQFWRTDGTPSGTWVIKDINPNANDYYANPQNFTDVNGTLFFAGNDGVHGEELWKSDGTTQGTQLVKDITPGSGSTFIFRLASAGGKLYFTAIVNGVQALWSSDGTDEGTQQITDAGLAGVNIADIYTAGNKLIFPGYTTEYGLELYAGTVTNDGKFVASTVTNSSAKTIANNILLYPNPAKDVVNVNLGSINTRNATLQVINIAGNILITKQVNANKQNLLQLNVSQLAAGSYFIKIISADETKPSIAKFEKQ